MPTEFKDLPDFSWANSFEPIADFRGQFETAFNFSFSEAMMIGPGAGLLIQDALVPKHMLFQVYLTLQSSLTCSYGMAPGVVSIPWLS